MKTGEGKTLVSTLPAYLNALTGKGVHVVTVNDYLAKRDSEWMGKVFNFTGLTTGCITNELSAIIFVGLTALSVETSTNVFISDFAASKAILYVPIKLFSTALAILFLS